MFTCVMNLSLQIGHWSRWLSDLFGMDEEDDSLEDKDIDHDNNERQNTSFKSFSHLNSLSDLLMLPKDMLLSASIRNEVCQWYCWTCYEVSSLHSSVMLKGFLFLKVCPMFSAQLIKKILDSFVPDEFCPDPVPATVFEALDSEVRYSNLYLLFLGT